MDTLEPRNPGRAGTLTTLVAVLLESGIPFICIGEMAAFAHGVRLRPSILRVGVLIDGREREFERLRAALQVAGESATDWMHLASPSSKKFSVTWATPIGFMVLVSGVPLGPGRLANIPDLLSRADTCRVPQADGGPVIEFKVTSLDDTIATMEFLATIGRKLLQSAPPEKAMEAQTDVRYGAAMLEQLAAIRAYEIDFQSGLHREPPMRRQVAGRDQRPPPPRGPGPPELGG